jgi:DNA replication licensing factor MCM6
MFSFQESDLFTYIEQIKSLSRHGTSTLYIDWSQLEENNDILALAISTQYYRMEAFLRKAIQNLVREYDPQYLQLTQDSNMNLRGKKSAIVA